jgi:NADH-ubiquinone oxidoreductase chain 4L
MYSIFPLTLFTVGVLGFALNRRNLLRMIISLEIMLLAVSVLAIEGSLTLEDLRGQSFAIYIISVAGIESAIGLSLLVIYYRLRGTIAL